MEDGHPCTSVALTVLCFTPRVAQDDGYTALMHAIREKNESAVTALLKHNANPDFQDKVPQDGAQWGYGGGWIYECNDVCGTGVMYVCERE